MNQASVHRLECDLLVIGSGMAGLSAGARAAEAGARVIVLEKAPHTGGSAALSGGFVWTAPSPQAMRGLDDGDHHLRQVVVDTYPQAMDWLRRRGVEMSPPLVVLFGRGYQIDIQAHFKRCVRTIEAARGQVVTGVQVEALLRTGGGAVHGARVSDGSGTFEVHAPVTLLATGGYQGDPDLRAQRIHPNARHARLRSNAYSTGDGARLGLEVGAVWAGENPGFYGHLVCSPVELDDPDTFATLTQYHSDVALLLNEAGQRFTDESLGDHWNAEALVSQPHARGLLVWDEYVQQERGNAPPTHGIPVASRLEVALQHGAQATRVSQLSDLAAAVTPWGFDGSAVVQTIERYNCLARCSPEQLAPPKWYAVRAYTEPPYYAMVVETGVTFTYGGLRIDEQTRALDAAGQPISGLLVAGADAGNVYHQAYAGGLALALTLGLRAAQTAGW